MNLKGHNVSHNNPLTENNCKNAEGNFFVKCFHLLMIWKCLNCQAAWFLLRFIHLFTNYLWNTYYVLNAKAVCIDLPSVCGPPTMYRWWDAAVNKQTWSLPSGISWSRGRQSVSNGWMWCAFIAHQLCAGFSGFLRAGLEMHDGPCGQ